VSLLGPRSTWDILFLRLFEIPLVIYFYGYEQSNAPPSTRYALGNESEVWFGEGRGMEKEVGHPGNPIIQLTTRAIIL
jgi:hypothetical protein